MSDDQYLDNPAQLFVGRLVQEVRNGTIDGFREFFESGPAGRSPNSRHVAQYEWFRSLGKSDKEKVMEVVSEVVDGALFGAMLLLDQEDPFDEDELYDFALYLQVYDDDGSYEINRFSRRSKKLNGPEDPSPLRNKYLDAVANSQEAGGNEQRG